MTTREQRRYGETEEPRNRQRERSQLSSRRLLAAAAELFAERGYRQTSLADIGKHAGYSHGLVTRRFGSKHGLLVALLDHVISDWSDNALAPAVGRQTGLQGIRAFLTAFAANVNTNSTTLRALESLMFEGLWAEQEFKDRLGEVQRKGQEQFRKLVQGGIENGTIRDDVDADGVAMMVSSALRGATYRWLLEDDFDLSVALNEIAVVLDTTLRAG